MPMPEFGVENKEHNANSSHSSQNHVSPRDGLGTGKYTFSFKGFLFFLEAVLEDTIIEVTLAPGITYSVVDEEEKKPHAIVNDSNEASVCASGKNSAIASVDQQISEVHKASLAEMQDR